MATDVSERSQNLNPSKGAFRCHEALIRVKPSSAVLRNGAEIAMVRTHAAHLSDQVLIDIRDFAFKKARRYNRENAEDVAQNIIHRILSGKIQIFVERNWRPLISTAVGHICIDNIRKDRGPIKIADRFVIEAVASCPDDSGALLVSNAVSVVLQRLPFIVKKAINLYMEGMDVPDIAHSTGLSQPTIYRYISNFKTQMRLLYLEQEHV